MNQFQEKVSKLTMQTETFRNKTILANDLMENKRSFTSSENSKGDIREENRIGLKRE
jgi:hypothetical protein